MVSAIITTHNRVDVLPRAIRSVLNQTYKDIELIVVSDGSTDGTDEYMKSYEHDTRVKYISYHPGHGGNYARNQGIKNANGDYVAFLDDDDEWLPQKIEKQVAKLDENPSAGLVYTAVRSIYVNEGVEYNFYPHCDGDMSKRILFGNFIGTTSCVMVRSSLLKEEMFDENLRALQDHDLWIRICQKADVCYCSEVLLNYYNQLSQKQITSNSDVYLTSEQYIREKYADLYKQFNHSELLSVEVEEFLGFARRCVRNGQNRLAREYVIRSLKKKITKKGISFYIMTYFSMHTILRLKSILNG